MYEDPTASLPKLLDDKRLFDEQVVEQLVAESYNRLGEDAKRTMEALAVFNQPVSDTAISYLLHPWFPGIDVRANLRRLVRSYFVRVSRTTGEYSIHPIDQEYAYHKIPNLSETMRSGEAYNRIHLELRAADFYASLRKHEADWRSEPA